MKHDILYLGSQSQSRQALLKEADIPFRLLEHSSDEVVERGDADFSAYVLAIAKHKMEHLIFPDFQSINPEHMFVLTADSLVRTLLSNQILGKPADERDAKRMLRFLRDESAEVVTGCCLEKKIWDGTTWQTHEARLWTTRAVVEFFIDEDSVDEYLTKVPQAYNSAGSAIIEGFGQNFFKSIQGSHTATRGLPIFELRQTLKALGFRFS